MAEVAEIEPPQSEPTTTADVALAAALDEARGAGELSPSVKAFFESQTRLADDQRHHMARQFELEQWSRRLKLLVQAMAVTAGAAIIGTVAAMAWSAHRASGVVVEPLSVPPDLAAKGTTGQVMASRVLDRLSEIDANVNSQRAPSTFARAWSGEIKVEIPQTGITFSELDRVLREHLGHETHIAGELVHTADGLGVTLRVDAGARKTLTGPESDLDGLVERDAEAIYAQIQPYRYSVYLRGQGRNSDAAAVDRRLADSGSPEDRPWAHIGLGNVALVTRGARAALAEFRLAKALEPRLFVADDNIGIQETLLGHWEAARLTRASAAARTVPWGIRREIWPAARNRNEGSLDLLTGDFQKAAETLALAIDFGPEGANNNLVERLAQAHIGLHDSSGALADLTRPNPSRPGFGASEDLDDLLLSVRVHVAAGQWSSALMESESAVQRFPWAREVLPCQLDPLRAEALASSGDLAGAEALISTTPQDCYPALVIRGRIAAMRSEWPIADRWFGAAAQAGHSLPFAESAWAESLLTRGNADGAIAKAKIAASRAPHFADPLELWGEVLTRQGDLNGATAKFAEAAKYAPNWGRLHLKWAESLARQGKADEARAQKQKAAGLDLTATERAELNSLKA